MDDLQWDLKKLTKQHREDSIGTQLARHQSLDLIARQLKEMGYRNLRAESLKPKHVEALVRRWQGEGLSVVTVKNRLSHLRWWAQKIGKPFALPEGNGRLGVENRTYVQGQGKQTALDPDKLAKAQGCPPAAEFGIAGPVRPAPRGGDQIPAGLCHPPQPYPFEALMDERRQAARHTGQERRASANC